MSTTDPKKSPTTCIVGCKLPHGLVLELFETDKDGKVIRVTGRHTLKGANDSRIYGGYGLTDNIPTDFMEEWFKRNAKHPAVVNHSIFMHSDVNSARSRAKDGRDVNSGLGSINPLDKSTQSRFKIHMDKDGENAYRRQLAENPVRNRQIQE